MLEVQDDYRKLPEKQNLPKVLSLKLKHKDFLNNPDILVVFEVWYGEVIFFL